MAELNYIVGAPSWCPWRTGEFLGVENPHMWWVSGVLGVKKELIPLDPTVFILFLRFHHFTPRKATG